MLRAGLIGLPSSGKTTLFQLLTSAREAPRTRGKAEANVGVSRVPDERLDRLTAMFNPKKRVPATVEFADMAARADGGAKALVDVVAYRNADALLHVVRAFRDPSVPHPHGIDRSARATRSTMEDELILADLGVVERRLERLEKDLKKTPTPELEKEQALLRALQGRARRRPAAARAGPRRRRRASGCAAFSSCRPSRCCSSSTSTRPISRTADDAAARRGLDGVARRDAAPRAVGVCAKIELEIAQLDPADARRSWPISGLARVGPRSRDPRELRPARLHLVLHRRRGRMPRLVDSARHAARRRRPARSTPTSSAASSAPRSCRTTRCSRAARSPPAAITASSGSKARSTSSPTATSSTSATPRRHVIGCGPAGRRSHE